MAIPPEMIKKWAEYTLLRIHQNLKKLKVHDTGSLAASLNSTLKEAAGGNVQLIQFFHLYYGVFTEWGVGRGVKIGQQGVVKKESRAMGLKPRRRKPWGARELWYQERRLAELASKETADAFLKAFERLEKKVKLFE